MLKVEPTLNHVPARRAHVVSLFESINQPLVNIPSHGTSTTGAFILGTRNEHGYFTVFVYLHQPDSKGVVIYVSEPRNLTPEQFKGEEQEALRFVESMGFLIDDVRFSSLNASEQEAVMARIPLFRPPERTVDLVEVHDSYDVPPLDDALPPGGAVLGEPDRPPPGAPFSGPGLSAMTGSMSSVPGGFAPGPATMPMAINPPGIPASGATPVGGPSSNAGTPVSGAHPASGSQAAQRDPAALKRLGRLLATFAWLLVFGCATPKTQADPRAVQTQLDLGGQHLARQAWPDAVRVYQAVLKEQPNNAHALHGLGIAYWRLGKLDDAERCFREALGKDPDWSTPRNELAVVLTEEGQCVEAEEQLRLLLEDIFYPAPENARHNLALALECQGRSAEAIQELRGLLQNKPRFCLGYLTMSEIASRAHDSESTVEACERFVEFCEKDERVGQAIPASYRAVCYLRKGVAYRELGDIESARAAFLRCEATGELRSECRQELTTLPP